MGRLRTLARIREALQRRPAQLEELRQQGKTVVGYFCCNVPEELIHAYGLVPIRLGRGGDDRLVEIGGRYISTNNCVFVREGVGLFATKEDPYVRSTDALAVAATCLQVYRLAEVVEHYFKQKTLVLGVPRNFYQPEGVRYFERAVEDFARRLEELAGAPLDAARLRESVALFAGIRRAIRELYELVGQERSQLRWREAFEAVQAGFYLDRVEYLALLEDLLREARAAKIHSVSDRPRLFLSGSIIPPGDTKLIDIVEEVGGEVVGDDLCTGLRPSLNLVVKEISSAGIARAYLERVPCASLPRLTLEGDQRLANLAEQIARSGADGVVYHTLRYCDPFTFKAAETKKFLGHLPFVEIHTEYATSDTEGIRTRVGAFVELLRGLRGDAQERAVAS